MSESMLETLRELVAIPSVSGHEDSAARYVCDVAERIGAVPRRVGNNVVFSIGGAGPAGAAASEPTGDGNDAAVTGAGGGRRLLINSHFDTVPPCAGWTIEPHGPVLREGPLMPGGALFGLGANDAKGSVVAMLGAARNLIAAGYVPKGEIVFCFVAEEETGGSGGIQSVLPGLGAFDAAIVGEPTGMRPCTAQRGMLLLRIVAKGTSGHVANVDMVARDGLPAENAIHKAARDITRLSEMRFEPHWLLGETRAQVTKVTGGLQVNQVPDACEFVVDFRTTPNLEHEELVGRIREVLESEVIVRSQRYLPKATGHDEAIVRAAVGATGREPIASNTTSDWAFLGAIPAVKMGPGDTARSHRADEHLYVGELDEAVRLYEATIRRYFELVSDK